MKRHGLVALATLAISSTSFAIDHNFIVTGLDVVSTSQKSLGSFKVIKKLGNAVIAKLEPHDKAQMSHIMHEEKHRCGGYFAFETLAQAEKFVNNSQINNTTKAIFADYTINQEEMVETYTNQATEASIRSTILKLSEFNNRYYKSETGLQSQEWLKAHWTSLTQHRSDITVDFFNHSGWKQPSVIATIKGESDEIIVIGGHADSISGWWGRERAKAPGADDNASGIATVTETLKILAKSGFRPKKTIMFMAYAAEEVGLLGSKDIATTFKREGKNVIGVLQLDMTNFNGSNADITLITDNTNTAQNEFIGNLIDTYQTNLTWGRDKCGYACSDHASWNSQGYPASMPFEAEKNDMNRQIHSSRDTLENMGGTADHALKFAKMALAFTIELDR